MEEGRAAFLLPFCCQSSKVSPSRRLSPTAHRPCMSLPCPASPPASRALRACLPVRPRLRGHLTVLSCARGVRAALLPPHQPCGRASTNYTQHNCHKDNPQLSKPIARFDSHRWQVADADFSAKPRIEPGPTYFSAPDVGSSACLLNTVNMDLSPVRYAPRPPLLLSRAPLLVASVCSERLSAGHLAPSPAPAPCPHASQLTHYPC